MTTETPVTPKARKKIPLWGWIVGGILALILIVSVVNGGTSAETAAADKPLTLGEALDADAETNPAPEPDEPSMTAGQDNAVREAESYLNTMAFSRTGLIEQLVFGGYSDADAAFAVDTVEVDWDEQAVLAAQEYLDTMPFTHSALVDQLVFGGFTPEEAEHGVTTAGL